MGRPILLVEFQVVFVVLLIAELELGVLLMKRIRLKLVPLTIHEVEVAKVLPFDVWKALGQPILF